MAKKRKEAAPAAPVAAPMIAARDLPPPSLPVRALWYLAAIFTFWSFGYTTMRASDLYWHVAAGQWTLDHGWIAMTDTYSYTAQGAPWHNYEWLTDLIYAIWVRVAGMDSLVYWKWLTVISVYLVLMRALERITGDLPASFLAATFALAVGQTFLDVRPHLFTLLGYTLLIWMCLRDAPRLWILPPMFWIWVNLHGGYFFGLMVLVPLLLPHLLTKEPYGPPGVPAPRPRTSWPPLALDRTRILRITGMFTLIVAACLVNPFGIQAIIIPLRYAFDPSMLSVTIGEWRPPFKPGGIPSPLFSTCVLVFLACAYERMRPAGEGCGDYRAWVGLGLGLLTMSMAWKARRFVPIFGISHAVLLALVLSRYVTHHLARVPAILPAGIALITGAAMLAPYPLEPRRAFHYINREDEFPIETVNWIEANQISGKVFNFYNWGGYLHWRTNGRLKTYIDGRADCVYDLKTYENYRRVLGFQPDTLAIIEGSDPDFVLWPNDTPRVLNALLQTGRWSVLYRDHCSTLLRRAASPVPARLVDSPTSGWSFLRTGVLAKEQGNPHQALPSLLKSLEVDPCLKAALEATMECWERVGETTVSRELEARCLACFPRASEWAFANRRERTVPAPKSVWSPGRPASASPAASAPLPPGTGP